MAKTPPRPKSQSAALPWRRTAAGDIEVLLITSRETRRWVIPKGWPIKGLKSGPSAAQEALEEAGVVGAVGKAAIGAFHYDKRLKTGVVRTVRVAVFDLEVSEELATWPEMHQRDKLWTTPQDAADRVDEPELQALLRTFRR